MATRQSVLVDYVEKGELPPNRPGIIFDDGYASNMKSLIILKNTTESNHLPHCFLVGKDTYKDTAQQFILILI